MQETASDLLGSQMVQRLLSILFDIAVACAVFGSPIAIILLLLDPHIGWWGSTLAHHSWLVVVLVPILLSRFPVGWVLHNKMRKYLLFLYSSEGKRHRAQEVQKSIAAIVAEAKAQPRIELNESFFEGLSPASVMTEARRLATNAAKDELRRRGVRVPWEADVIELKKIANALLETDQTLIVTASANLRKRAGNSRA